MGHDTSCARERRHKNKCPSLRLRAKLLLDLVVFSRQTAHTTAEYVKPNSPHAVMPATWVKLRLRECRSSLKAARSSRLLAKGEGVVDPPSYGHSQLREISDVPGETMGQRDACRWHNLCATGDSVVGHKHCDDALIVNA